MQAKLKKLSKKNFSFWIKKYENCIEKGAVSQGCIDIVLKELDGENFQSNKEDHIRVNSRTKRENKYCEK